MPPPSSTADPALAPGRRLGRYELVRPLGEGGMGQVWEAVLHGPEGFRRPVALKVLKPGKDPTAGRIALTREARLGALLSHPNVVATYEVGDADGHWFLSMELVRGATVGDLGGAGPIPPGVLLDVGIQACAGLAHVHGLELDGAPAGLVHRDLKPRNLLVDRSGLVKIADLGIARLGAGPERAAGTAGYAAPEQLEGREDARADLFSLGVVLFLMALDEMPFGRGRRALVEVLRADERLTRDRAVERLDARIPGLGAVVTRLLRVDPAERFDSAAELGQALRALRVGVEDGPSLLDLLGNLRPDVRPAEAVSGSARPLASTTATVLLSAGNLPRPEDRTIGREAEVARLADRIREGGLVTVLGLGGMGKTRLSLEAGRRIAPELAGGAWFVDLSAATDVGAVVSTVASALGVPPGRDADPVGQVGHALKARGRALLILDNLEQVVEAAAGPIGRWRALAPDTAIVVTSRIATRVPGERILPLGPLAPDEAARLFVERAARPPSDDEAPRVADLVAALEGIPLAIELAAARTRVLPLGALIDRLDQRLKLLAGGGRERPERHRSLRASLDGSFELLTTAQRAAMAQLSVFADGFLLEAAEAVIDLSDDPDAPWALDLVEALVDHSLLRFDRGAGRFRMLQVVRDYAGEHLAPEAREAVQRRHAAWFAQLGTDEAIATHHGPGGAAALRRTAAERENLIAATRSALRTGRTELLVPLLRATWTVLELQGPPAEGEALARAVLVRELSPLDRARATLVLAWTLDHLARLPEAAAAFAEAAEVAEAAGAFSERGRALAGLAMISRQRGDVDGADAAYRASIESFRRAGEPDAAARVTCNYGSFLAHRGQLDVARPMIEGAMPAARRSGDPRFVALVHHHLGNLAKLVGDAVAHLEHTAAAHAVTIEIGDRRMEGQMLANLALGEAMFGRHDEAMRLYELARPIHAEVGDRKAEAVLLGNLALEMERLGRLDEAHDCYQQCLVLYRDIGSVDGVGQTLGNLALLLRRQGRLAEAEEAVREAIAIHQRVRNRRSEGITTGSLGLIAVERGDLDEARRLQEEALRIHREVRNRRSEGITLGNLGYVHQQAGRLAEAEEAYRAALAIHRELANRASEGQMWTNLGTLAARRGDRAEARRCLREAVVLHRETTHPDKRLQAAAMLAELAVEDGDDEEASRWLDEAEEATTTFAELTLPPELAALRDRLRGH